MRKSSVGAVNTLSGAANTMPSLRRTPTCAMPARVVVDDATSLLASMRDGGGPRATAAAVDDAYGARERIHERDRLRDENDDASSSATYDDARSISSDIALATDVEYATDVDAGGGDGLRRRWASAPGQTLRVAAIATVALAACALGLMTRLGMERGNAGALGRREGSVRGDWARYDPSSETSRARPGGFRHEKGFKRSEAWTPSEFAAERRATTRNSMAWLGSLFGFMSTTQRNWNPTDVVTHGGVRLPASFDAREKWPYCASLINEIVDQGNCGSCWAVAPAKVMSERLCIASHGGTRTHLSAQQLLSCGSYEAKAFDKVSMGGTCDGGYPTDAYLAAYENGLVSGGLFGDTKTCMPYMFKPCKHPCEVGLEAKCPVTCLGEAPVSKVYKVKSLTHCGDNDFDCMALEIYHNGPVSSYAGTIYDEFYDYKSGVYAMSDDVGVRGSSHGGHVLEVIGWGTKPDGTIYWKVFNSWLNWGDKGYGEIAVGELSIGESVEAAIMLPHPQATT